MDEIAKFLEMADDDLEQILLESLRADPDYWEDLERLEREHGACREWDNAVEGDA